MNETTRINNLTFDLDTFRNVSEDMDLDEQTLMINYKQGTVWVAKKKRGFIHIKVERDPREIYLLMKGFCPVFEV